MQLKAHCFANKVKISTLPISFKYKDFNVKIDVNNTKDIEGLILELSTRVEPGQFSYNNLSIDEKGSYIERWLRPYKETLTEVSHLIEGYLSIMYFSEPPRFNPEKVVVNIYPENKEEEEMIRNGSVSGGFGDIFQDEKYPSYTWSEKIIPSLNQGMDHLAGLSFLSQAIRSQQRNDQEIAFFLYFRVFEGYLSDGTKDIEKALIKNQVEITKYIPYIDETKNTIMGILKSLKLHTKSDINFEGLISDLVLIRHKLTHFSKTHSDRHHNAAINFELNPLNNILRRACVLLLRDQIGIK